MIPAELIRAVRRARRVTVLTGAGISAESGIPTFRAQGALWGRFRPEDLATPEAFARDPETVWGWYRWRRGLVASAQPNAGHLALADLAGRVPALALLTQNVDGLHTRAGSRDVAELHGNIWRSRCAREPARVFDDWALRAPEDLAESATLPRCACGALRRPDVVWFGEPLDPAVWAQAEEAASGCDVLLVVGTSALVYPVAGLPALVREAGARLVEINPEATPLSPAVHDRIPAGAGAALPALVAAL